MIVKEITNCKECPFSNTDNERGLNKCNLKDIDLDCRRWEELPSDKVHDDCPLKNNDYLITINN